MENNGKPIENMDKQSLVDLGCTCFKYALCTIS